MLRQSGKMDPVIYAYDMIFKRVYIQRILKKMTKFVLLIKYINSLISS